MDSLCFKKIVGLAWKSFQQRRYYWPILVVEMLIAAACTICILLFAGPGLFNQDEFVRMHPPLTENDVYKKMPNDVTLSYAPTSLYIDDIIKRAGQKLGRKIPFDQFKNYTKPHFWVFWKETQATDDRKSYVIRYTESPHADLETHGESFYLKSGFMSVQMALDTAILDELIEKRKLKYKITLKVQQFPHHALDVQMFRMLPNTYILILITLSLIQSGLETQWFMMKEDNSNFILLLTVYGISNSIKWINWMIYSSMTSFLVSLCGSCVLVMIFRWSSPVLIFMLLFIYSLVLTSWALLISIFHENTKWSSFWALVILADVTLVSLMFSYLTGQSVHWIFVGLISFILPPLAMLNCIDTLIAADYNSDSLDFSDIRSSQSLELGLTMLFWLFAIIIHFALTVYFQNRNQKGVAKYKRSFKTSTQQGSTNWDNVESVPETKASAIRCHKIGKNVSFNTYRGEISCLYGRHGSGKSALMHVIAGLGKETQGTVHIWGYDVYQERDQLVGIVGFCPNDDALRSYLTVEQHLSLFFKLGRAAVKQTENTLIEDLDFDDDEDGIRIPPHEHDLARLSLLEHINIDSIRTTRVKDLNDPGRLKLRFALAALQGARVLLFDNPDEGLSVEAKEMLWAMITAVRPACSVLISTENDEIASKISDRIYSLNNFRICCAGTPIFIMNLYGQNYNLNILLQHAHYEDVNNFVAKHLPQAFLYSALGFSMKYSFPVKLDKQLCIFLNNLETNKGKLLIRYFTVTIPTLNDIHYRSCNSKPQIIKHDTKKLNWQRVEGKLNKTFVMKTIRCRRRRTFNFLYYFIAVAVPIVLPLTIICNYKKDIEISTPKALTVDDSNYEDVVNLVLRTSNDDDAKRIGYLYSCNNRPDKALDLKVLSYDNNLEKRLVQIAVEVPVKYVAEYFFAMDVNITKFVDISVNAMYAITDEDTATAPRTLNKATSTLLKFMTKDTRQDIVVYDEPITPKSIQIIIDNLREDILFIPLIAVIVYSIHTSISKPVHWLSRVNQINSRVRHSVIFYWITLFIVDFGYYLIMIVMFLIVIPIVLASDKYFSIFGLQEYGILGLLFLTFGLGEFPFTYLFQRILNGRGFNMMFFIVNNIIIGLLLTEYFFHDFGILDSLLNSHPCFNFIYGYSKFTAILYYNSLCDGFLRHRNCSDIMYHPCCPNCKVIDVCFKKKNYLQYYVKNDNPGLLREITASVICCFVYFALIFLVEYKFFQKIWHQILNKLIYPGQLPVYNIGTNSVTLEKIIVEEQLKSITKSKCLLIHSLWFKNNGNQPTLRDINIQASPGEAIAVSDSNSDGKECLLKILAGFGPISFSGSVYLPNTIGYCCNENAFLTLLTVRENLELVADLRGVPSEYIKEETDRWLQALDLNDYSGKICKNLNIKVAKKLNLALALVGDPALLVLDNPIYNMDYASRRQAYAILSEIRNGNQILIYGTSKSSSLEEVETFCSRIAVIVNGQLINVNPLSENIRNMGFIIVIKTTENNVDEDFRAIFAIMRESFKKVHMNDHLDNFINLQILDSGLTWSQVFAKMENIKEIHARINSYVVTSLPFEEIFRNWVQKGSNQIIWNLPPICCPRNRKRYKEKLPRQSTMNIESRHDLRFMGNISWRGIFANQL